MAKPTFDDMPDPAAFATLVRMSSVLQHVGQELGMDLATANAGKVRDDAPARRTATAIFNFALGTVSGALPDAPRDELGHLVTELGPGASAGEVGVAYAELNGWVGGYLGTVQAQARAAQAIAQMLAGEGQPQRQAQQQAPASAPASAGIPDHTGQYL